MNFYSQCKEDVWLYNNGFLDHPGFYIDIGAADPFINSNTVILDQLNWKGLCVDPAIGGPNDLALRYDGRSCETVAKAVNTYNGYCQFNIAGEAGKITTSGKHTVECITLKRLVEDFGIEKIDLLSIDVEGMEYEILSDYWCHTFYLPKPKIIIAEYVTFGVQDMRLRNFLTKYCSYAEICRTTFNIIYHRVK